MRKIILWTLTSIFFFIFSATVYAADIVLESDKEGVMAGEDISITITLERTVDFEKPASMLQGELYYDSELFGFKSVQLSEDYQFLTVTPSKREPRIQFSWFDVNSGTDERTIKNLTAGEMITVIFTALNNISTEVSATEFQLFMDIKTADNTSILSYNGKKIIEMYSDKSDEKDIAGEDIFAEKTELEDVFWNIENGQSLEEESFYALKQQNDSKDKWKMAVAAISIFSAAGTAFWIKKNKKKKV
ncbi:MAG: hypothetical protein E7253_08560 [Lachnospiraceae bacterium]|nr:hypothetical protein [Lachnospiraceae bacterium]